MGNNKKIGCIIICALFSIFLIKCCINESFCVTDNYFVHAKGERIFPNDDFGMNGFYLWCNPGCEYDAMIDHVKSIRWDKRHIIVEQKEEGETNWYLIIARGEELMCCNRDTTIGPITESEMESLVKSKNLNVRKMKKRRW